MSVRYILQRRTAPKIAGIPRRLFSCGRVHSAATSHVTGLVNDTKKQKHCGADWYWRKCRCAAKSRRESPSNWNCVRVKYFSHSLHLLGTFQSWLIRRCSLCEKQFFRDFHATIRHRFILHSSASIEHIFAIFLTFGKLFSSLGNCTINKHTLKTHEVIRLARVEFHLGQADFCGLVTTCKRSIPIDRENHQWKV